MYVLAPPLPLQRPWHGQITNGLPQSGQQNAQAVVLLEAQHIVKLLALNQVELFQITTCFRTQEPMWARSTKVHGGRSLRSHL